MGDRGQVNISGVYLYTHWGAYDLINDVYKALIHKKRWNDHEYLARIIFDEMKSGENNPFTGYGIGTSKHGDIWRLIKIEDKSDYDIIPNNIITIIDNNNEIFKASFNEFIKRYEEGIFNENE